MNNEKKEAEATDGAAVKELTTTEQASVESTPEAPTSEEEPTAEESDSAEEPTAEESDSVEEPTAEESDSVDEPTAEESDSVDEPTAEESNSVKEPTTEERDSAQKSSDNIVEVEAIEEEEIELWNDLQTKSAIEALLFVSDESLTKNELAKLVKNADKATINRAITQLTLEYAGERGIYLAEIDGGFQFRTNPDLSNVILRMYEVKPLRLSKAILETLAIVAYQQPVTKARADEIRGVDCSGSLKKLIGYDLVSVIGRADDIGRPNLYATTTRFLEFFGMNSITDMPTLEEFEVDALELVGEDLREFLPEDERESILADHVTDGEVERSERTHELGDASSDENEEEVEETNEQVEVYPSSAANDDGVLKEEEE